MRCGEPWLPVVIKRDLVAGQVAVSAYDLLLLRIPHYELLVGIPAGVKLVKVKALARSAAGLPESYLAQTAYLAHHVGGVLPCHYVDVVVALVGVAQLAFGGQLRLQQFLVYGLYYLLHA